MPEQWQRLKEAEEAHEVAVGDEVMVRADRGGTRRRWRPATVVALPDLGSVRVAYRDGSEELWPRAYGLFYRHRRAA